MKRLELVGQKFNLLTVIEFAYIKNQITYWKCLCDCGNTCTVNGKKLKRGNPKSCGHLGAVPDLIGKVIGRLTVINKVDWNGNKRWECKCNCGNPKLTYLRTVSVNNGKTNSCGCIAKEKVAERNKTRALYSPIEANARIIWRDVYSHDGISFDDFYKLSQMNCYYCGDKPSNYINKNGAEGDEFIYNGLDRVNSSIGHTLNNCVPCCFPCNQMKSNKTVGEFKDRVEKIYKFMKTNPVG